MTFEGTFLSIFINKKELLLTGCITNQFYLEKSKPTEVKVSNCKLVEKKYITVYEK